MRHIHLMDEMRDVFGRPGTNSTAVRTLEHDHPLTTKSWFQHTHWRSDGRWSDAPLDPAEMEQDA